MRGRLRECGTALLLFLCATSALPGCRTAPVARAASPVSPGRPRRVQAAEAHSRPRLILEDEIEKVVVASGSLPLDMHRAVILALARRLGTGRKDEWKKPQLGTLIVQLIYHEHYETVDYLDQTFGESKADAGAMSNLRFVVLRESSSPDVRQLLRDMARRSPDSLQLAAHRTGGFVYLLRVAEDDSAYTPDRVESLEQLGEFADRTVLERLRRLTDNSTECLLNCSPLGRPLPTIGGLAQRSIERIERRLPP